MSTNQLNKDEAFAKTVNLLNNSRRNLLSKISLLESELYRIINSLLESSIKYDPEKTKLLSNDNTKKENLKALEISNFDFQNDKIFELFGDMLSRLIELSKKSVNFETNNIDKNLTFETQVEKTLKDVLIAVGELEEDDFFDVTKYTKDSEIQKIKDNVNKRKNGDLTDDLKKLKNDLLKANTDVKIYKERIDQLEIIEKKHDELKKTISKVLSDIKPKIEFNIDPNNVAFENNVSFLINTLNEQRNKNLPIERYLKQYNEKLSKIYEILLPDKKIDDEKIKKQIDEILDTKNTNNLNTPRIFEERFNRIEKFLIEYDDIKKKTLENKTIFDKKIQEVVINRIENKIENKILNK